MTYIFIAADPNDHDFTVKLRQDLQAANLDNWHPEAVDTEIYSHLQKASHIIAVLTPSVLLNENFLAALEYGKQNGIPRIPLRLKPVETLPPQLQGNIPIDFSKPDEYSDALQTLLEDLNIEPAKASVQLPSDLLDRLHSDSIDERQNAIMELRDFKQKGDTLRNLARDELAALVFREREPSLKALVATTLKLFDNIEDEPIRALPSKEDLVEQAERAGMSVVIEEDQLRISVPKKYLWQAPRWHLIVGGIGLIIAIILFAITRDYPYVLPLMMISLLLPHFNVMIRQGGNFYWKPQAAQIGNAVMAAIIGGLVALVLAIAGGLDLAYLGINLVICAVYGAVVGWLSTLRV